MARYLITSALPYANGPLHFGHITGAYLPADIFTRFLKMQGEDAIYICGTDEHGMAITLAARQEKRSPREHVDHYYKIIKQTFDMLDIKFDYFSRTTSPTHYKLAQQFFKELFENEYIEPKVNKQYYCPNCKIFLADRYIEGTCPYCGYEHARGDECPKCGSWLEPFKLINPRCKICGTTPIVKDTKHWYLLLPKLEEKLLSWLNNNTHWKETVRATALGIIKEGLKERAITRDIDWGVPVPIEDEDAKNKVLYVWFDAPIGYISFTIEWAEAIGKPDAWKDYWQDPNTKIYHFIGKDNIPFHTVFWPAMLMGQKTKWNLPYDVPANAFYNIEGRKFSTSDGWFVDIPEFLNKFHVDSLRYYLTRTMPENRDSEFLWHDFQAKHNNELLSNFANYALRVLKFINSKFDGKLPPMNSTSDYDKKVIEEAKKLLNKAKQLLYSLRFNDTLMTVMELSSLGNKYLNDREPWKLVKTNKEEAGSVMYISFQILRMVTAALYPFIPSTAKKVWNMMKENLDIEKTSWDKIAESLPEANKTISSPSILFNKIEDSTIKEEKEKMMSNLQTKDENTMENNYITYDEFRKVELKVGKVLEAEKVPNTDKLLKLKVDLGNNDIRTLVAGVAKYYTPEKLIGKNIIVVANLQPRKLRGITSQGMLLAAVDPKKDILSILSPDAEVPPGTPIS